MRQPKLKQVLLIPFHELLTARVLVKPSTYFGSGGPDEDVFGVADVRNLRPLPFFHAVWLQLRILLVRIVPYLALFNANQQFFMKLILIWFTDPCKAADLIILVHSADNSWLRSNILQVLDADGAVFAARYD